MSEGDGEETAEKRNLLELSQRPLDIQPRPRFSWVFALEEAGEGVLLGCEGREPIDVRERGRRAR